MATTLTCAPVISPDLEALCLNFVSALAAKLGPEYARLVTRPWEAA
jgi:hypothetical protein